MPRVVVLDASPLWLAAEARQRKPDAERCRAWIALLAAAGTVVIVPEIADYEVRRELLRRGNGANIRRLNGIRDNRHHLFARINSDVMAKAAELWADARNHGVGTAGPKDLDADVILAAQARLAIGAGDRLTIATDNVGHFKQLGFDARPWDTIAPAGAGP